MLKIRATEIMLLLMVFMFGEVCARSLSKDLEKRVNDGCFQLDESCSDGYDCMGSCYGFSLFCYEGIMCTVFDITQPYRKKRSLSILKTKGFMDLFQPKKEKIKDKM